MTDMFGTINTRTPRTIRKATRKLWQRPFNNDAAVKQLYMSYVVEARNAAKADVRSAIEAARNLRMAMEAGYV